MARGENNSFMRLAGKYTSLAFLLPSCVLVGYGIGHLIDRALGTRFFYIIFLLLGIAAGFVQMIRMIQKDAEHNGQ